MKIYRFFVLIIIIPLCGGCLKSATKNTKPEIYYFDLKTFFNNEAHRLTKANKTINKTVWLNNTPEKKQIKITKWASELSFFSNSDINKTAWQNSYRKDSTATKITYTAKFSDLKTRSITIYIANKKPIRIKIINHQKNYIFENWENLLYLPDAFYRIEKKQKLLFWDADVYKVEGFFTAL